MTAPVRYVSLCSGVEAATVAWAPMGWVPVAFAEFAEFPSAVLAHHWPAVPNLGDITKITEAQIKRLGPVEGVVFGTPCQDLSIAGLRKGFDGERSCLFRDAVRVVGWLKKHCGLKFGVWENVTGAFSSAEGRDFLEILQLLTGAEQQIPNGGWQTAGAAFGKAGIVEWRVFDAQFSGVPQRRRRVFAFINFGNWECTSPVLFEPESLFGDSEPSLSARQDIAKCLVARPHSSHCASSDTFIVAPFDLQGFGDYGLGDKASTCQARDHKGPTDLVVHGTMDPIVSDKAHCLGRNQGQENVLISQKSDVRRLTPREGERLQGFNDDHTLIPWKGKLAQQCPDGPRYSAIGNSIAVPVLVWIGQQIAANFLPHCISHCVMYAA
jgi:DNA (cytosine-5)-methyltransferase 1